MADRLPLPSLLSQALVAFTVEFDNEFEHRMPHRTTRHSEPGDRGPWLVSMVMWFNCVQFVTGDAMLVSELQRRARTGTNLDGMRRWGYVFLEPESGGPRRKPRPEDLTIRATRKGQQAQQVWRPLAAEIEERWRGRFGADRIVRLRASLWALAARARADLPDCLPILRYGLFNGQGEKFARREPDTGPGPDPGLPLPVLLARVLLGFAIRFEQESALSLAICANVLRVLDTSGVRVRDLPVRSGVSKEAIAMALSFLGQDQLAYKTPGRGQRAVLTAEGQEAQWGYADRIAAIERGAGERFGKAALARLREDLEALVGDPACPEESPLMSGLEPYPDNWRADARPPQTLPHYPMVLHRGGYPDAS